MQQSPCHLIATVRAKQDYVLQEKNGKQVPEKVGLKGITREGMDYEFTLLLELSIHHQARASKDRTGLFSVQPDFTPDVDTGRQILTWCRQGTTPEQVKQLIHQADSITGLIALYNHYPEFRQVLNAQFVQRKEQLQIMSNSLSNQSTK